MKHTMYTVVSFIPTIFILYIVLAFMLFLGLAGASDAEQLNTKVSEIEKNRGYRL